jgi:hypothetical protein
MKLSQLALSYGFAGPLMLGTVPWLVRIATYSAEAYGLRNPNDAPDPEAVVAI